MGAILAQHHAADGSWCGSDAARVVRAVTTAECLRGLSNRNRLLYDWECARAARLRVEQDRRDFVGAHLLVRDVAAELLSVPAAAVRVDQRCPRCGRHGHGRPRISAPGCPPLFASWSHGAGRIAAAAAFAPVGVDVEAAHVRALSDRALRLVLAPSELARLRIAAEPELQLLNLWTRKEALVKVGAISLDDFARTDLTQQTDHWSQWQLASWHDGPRGLVAAVAFGPREEDLATPGVGCRRSSSGGSLMGS